LSRTVIDQTGVTGEFDFTMSWAPDADPAAEGPSLPTALTESLGLRLESKKAPVDVIVIDQIEKPTEN
jgi:uncharacterized protein (TIGR03435 family)